METPRIRRRGTTTRLRAVGPVNTLRKSNVTRSHAPNWDAAAVAALKLQRQDGRVPRVAPRRGHSRNYRKLILMRTGEPGATCCEQ